MYKIQPVSKGYFPSLKVTLREIAGKRRSGVAIYAERLNPENTVTKVWLIPEPVKFVTVGKLYDFENTRTKRPYGKHCVLAVFKFRYVSGVLVLGDLKPGTQEYSEAFDLEAVAFEMS
jgi:hypothetical protein